MRSKPGSSSSVHAGVLVAIVVAAGISGTSSPRDFQQSVTPRIVDDAALADEASGDNWLAYGRTYSEQRFSPLTADQRHHRGPPGAGLVRRAAQPTAGSSRRRSSSNGVLYFIGSMNVVRAVDATSGKLLWEFDPEVRAHAGRLRAGWDHNRGIGFWKGKVYAATWDGRLFAIDARSGKEIWRVNTVAPDQALYITGAPKIFKGKVLIGNGGTENGPSRGYVTAYDAETGKQAWRFYIVPGNPADGFENEAMRMAAKTWTGAVVAPRRRRQRVAWLHLRCGARSALHRHRQRIAVEPEDPQS